MKKTRLATVAFIFLVPLGLLAQSATPSDGYYAGSFARLHGVGPGQVAGPVPSADGKAMQTIIQVKEIKMRPKTEEHDFEFKLRHAERFLKEGNKAKVYQVRQVRATILKHKLGGPT